MTALRTGYLGVFGAGAVICLLVGLLMDFSVGDFHTVDDPTRIELATGRDSGHVVIYGKKLSQPARFWTDGCDLLDADGNELNRARVTETLLFGPRSVKVDGVTLEPLAEVSKVSAGQVLACPEFAKASPVAASSPTPTGSNGRVIQVMFVGSSLLFLAMMVISWHLAPTISRWGIGGSRGRSLGRG